MMPQISLRRPAALTGTLLVALTLMLAPAQAATVDYSLTLPAAAAANPLVTSITGAGATMDENVSGNAPFRRSPWDAANSPLDFTDAGSIYSALYNGDGSKTAVNATFELSGVFRKLRLVWGTPGPLNTLKLLLDGVEQFSLTGAGPFGFSGHVDNSVLVTIGDVAFDEIVIGADHRAFEFSNMQTLSQVPVPAAGLLLAGALGGLAALRRRKAA